MIAHFLEIQLDFHWWRIGLLSAACRSNLGLCCVSESFFLTPCLKVLRASSSHLSYLVIIPGPSAESSA